MKGSILLHIAKESIKDSLYYTNNLDIEKIAKENPWLKDDGATFVTLMLNGKLRGCIGSLIAQRALLDDLIYNANMAAFRDPRFPKLTREEFKNLHVEVSLLSEPKELEYADIEDLHKKITPNIHGVIISHHGRQATFLPQVWEELPSFESFFAHLLSKAGLPKETLLEHPTIYTYTVEKFS
ncbi:MAG: AmmeMemoRadiSam system protein A [Sulfurospirillaceae bacterium]|nr:AmmeMemoRadiSam system protein A [Sulfurospirillaceae bacterium]